PGDIVAGVPVETEVAAAALLEPGHRGGGAETTAQQFAGAVPAAPGLGRLETVEQLLVQVVLDRLLDGEQRAAVARVGDGPDGVARVAQRGVGHRRTDAFRMQGADQRVGFQAVVRAYHAVPFSL